MDISLLGLVGPISVLYLFYILAKLSERLGSVEKMPANYRYYYVALVFLLIGYASYLLLALQPETMADWFDSVWFLLLAYYLPQVIGVTIGLVVTWRYWGCLIIERTN